MLYEYVKVYHEINKNTEGIGVDLFPIVVSTVIDVVNELVKVDVYVDGLRLPDNAWCGTNIFQDLKIFLIMFLGKVLR